MSKTTIDTTPAPDLAAEIDALAAQQAAQALADYFAGVRSPKPDARKLLALATAAGKTADDVKTDFAGWQQIQAARAAVKQHRPDAELAQAQAAALRAIDAHDAQTEQIAKTREEERNRLAAALWQAGRARDVATAARDALASLESAAWQLLGGPAPAQAEAPRLTITRGFTSPRPAA